MKFRSLIYPTSGPNKWSQ